MDQFFGMGRFVIIAFIHLIAHFLSITAKEQVVSPTNVCSPQNPECYYERFGNFKVPQVEPIKASMNFKSCFWYIFTSFPLVEC